MDTAINVILGLIALGGLVAAGRIVIRKFSTLANINVHALPERKQVAIRRQILEDKLRRDFKTRMVAIREFIFAGRAPVKNVFSKTYDRLKDLEHEYRIARKKDLSSQVSKTQSIETMVADARERIAADDLARAEQILVEALKLDDHNVKVYALLAEVYRERGEYDHAKETLEFLAQLTDRKDPDVYADLAGLALDRGDFSTARDDFQRSINLDPENYRHHLDLAEVYVAMGDHEKAQTSSQQALELAPNNPKVLDFLIENSIILQDKNRAQEYLDKLIDVNPENGKIHSYSSRIAELA